MRLAWIPDIYDCKRETERIMKQNESTTGPPEIVQNRKDFCLCKSVSTEEE